MTTRLSQSNDLSSATLVISDGSPDNATTALGLAAQFRGVIDVLYIGPENDVEAIAFMRELAAAGGGRLRIEDLSTPHGAGNLLTSIAGMLPHSPS